MLDLTSFGFTPTESLVYEVLVTRGPGTGYAIARAAGLARANAYSALEGLVTKGAARADEGKPRRFRPEPPAVVLGRIVDRQGQAVEELARALEAIALPPSPTLTEITSLRGTAQLLSLEVARATADVRLFLPPEVYALLGPALRRAAAGGVRMDLICDSVLEATPVPVRQVDIGDRWPGRPLLAAIDRKAALVGTLEGDRVTGHWGMSPTIVAAVLLAIDHFSAGPSGGT
jgi:sugar-specific transcriptional regulator TrmB